MKNIRIQAIVFMALTSLFAGCSNDNEAISGTGNLEIEFDNAYGNNDLILTTQANTTSNNEVLKIDKVKYIISNIVLTNEDGTTYVYPKNKSYFIVDEASSANIELEGIPAGNYKKIKFGIGVDQAQWELGADGQGDFLVLAQTAGMIWTWSAGYKFLAFEGTFTSATVTTPTAFMVHTGKTGTDYNYTEITLDLPSNALVRKTISPEIHVVTDVSKIIDGTNKFKFSESAMIMGGASLPLIVANLSHMFNVAHVHND